MRKIFLAAVMVLAALALTRCGSSKSKKNSIPSQTGQGFSYSSTSSKGDYAEWTFTGQTLTAVWKEINGTGGVDRTLNITANCDTYDSTYNYHTCTITDSSCAPGVGTCNGNPSGKLEMMEVPGVALFVHSQVEGEQLHMGILKDGTACAADVSGDYVFAHTAHASKELVGIYRSDSDFTQITHADFIMKAASSTAKPDVEYSSSDALGQLTFGNPTCSDGVRTRTIGSMTVRSMVTPAGIFILDLPAGMGGLIAIKTTMAAALSDFANKQFAGIVFTDQGESLPMALNTGAATGSAVEVASAFIAGNPLSNIDIRPLSNNQSRAANPPYADFTAVNDNDAGNPYASNALQADYGSLAATPGLFRLDGDVDGRILVTAGKFNGKVIAFGLVYNWRSRSPSDVPFDADALYSTGNFLLFEK
jgi:hypothetical protein